ncbi:C6 and C2H2 transcription factor, putative [Metarhizium acridum CQMa 102]|uniref:C6 and C2H2 transcription factor, putative n=1 Tax=Metarhizium acridum (strain CQMa 102) TaxID=655827 RepID=E9DXA5_METAQ|nr:C6 and C2H2 transcription factor, putative [Metarhizium acridum CQMa 102]EFY91663.1 C6 and C2H2 transcription factor, putative [Metarhizium acridum CQMa 102]
MQMPSDVLPGTPPRGTQSSKDASFSCSWPGCGRMYRKREHLQRHERSHARDFKYECPICKKRFVRRDVMTRHRALHETRPRKLRKVACVSCVSLKTRCDRQPGARCSRCVASGWECILRNNEGNQENEPTPNHHDGLEDANQSSLMANLAQPVIGSALDLAPVSFEPLYGLATDPSDSFFGWDIGEVESENVDFLDMSPLNWFRSANEAPEDITEPPSTSRTVELSSSSSLIRDEQPSDTPWPHVYRPTEIDNQLNLLPVDQHTATIFQDTNLDCIDESTRQAIITLVNTTNNHNWPVVDVALLPSTRTLSTCINLYFRHFHDTLPILPYNGLRTPNTPPPILLLAMAAIGAMYSRDKYGGLAIALNELVRRVIIYTREKDQRAMFDLRFAQASLLQSVFGLFCGSRMLYQHAEISRGSLVTAARRMHLLRPSLSFVKELQKNGNEFSEEELKKAQADDEERRNLGWGIYLYDMQISALLNVAPLLSVGEINVPLPSGDEAGRGHQPSALDMNLGQDGPNFREVLESLLLKGKLSQPLSSFGLSIVAYTLYRYGESIARKASRLIVRRLCTDAAVFDSVLPASRPPRENPYRLAFPPTFRFNPQQLLDQLSASCHSLPNKPNTLILSVTALSHLGHIQFTWPNFLQNIKVAAGKSGTDESKADAREWVRARIEEDPVITRGSDNSAASDWIQHGGEIAFQGLGSMSELTISKVLSIFIERLESMSWGIAQRFKHVLLSLQREE